MSQLSICNPEGNRHVAHVDTWSWKRNGPVTEAQKVGSSDARSLKPYAQAFPACLNGCSSGLAETLATRGECFRPSGSAQLQRTGPRTVRCTKSFPQEQVSTHSSDVPPAHKMGDPSRRARTPARLKIRTVHAMEVFCRLRSAPVARNTHCQSLQLSLTESPSLRRR